MKCPECDSENLDDNLFCNQCGTQLLSIDEIPTRTDSLHAPIKELSTGSTFAGRYQVIEELGKGGMGKVYKVLDSRIKEKVALKLLNPEIATDEKTIERFRNELKFTRQIAHKNVCRMYDLNKEEETYYITMEYVQGDDLKGLIRQVGKLSLEKALSVADQVCEGLTEAHRLGIVHRDLKPGNIMIDKEGNARIMDFGVARSVKAKGITRKGAIVGTPEYMSPEQVEGKGVDHRSDLYSLGIILFEMVTGRVPFEGDTPLNVVLKHKTERPQNPKEINDQIPEELSQMILKCLEKEKEKRYQSAGELRTELIKIEKNISATEIEDHTKRQKTEKISKPDWKKILPYASGAVIIILLILGGVYFLTGVREVIDSVAVLPFEIANGDSDTEYLTDGITESIIKKLAQLPSLRKVIARSSVFRYKGREIDPQAVGQELDVDAVLVSRMSRLGDELFMSVELIKVQDNSRIWGNRYRRTISEIFGVQEEITDSITDNLRLRLTGEERERIRKRYTENSEAFLAYSKGRYFWNKRTEEDLERAIDYFEQALQSDPNYALAYTGLSHSYLLLPEYGTYKPKDVYPKAREYALKALEIDDLLSEARVSLAQIKRRYDYNWSDAIREYKRAIELDPNNATAHHWYGYDLMCVGRFDEAISEIKRALELDPLSLVINRNLGQVLFRAGKHEEAMEALQRALEMDPKFSSIHLYIGSIYFQQSRYEEALEEFQKEKELARGWGVRAEAWIGVANAKMGERAKAQAILDDLLRKSEQIHVSETLLAILYFALDDEDQGFQWLDKAYEEYDSWLRLIGTESVFDRIRSDPRFVAVLSKMDLQ
ncbi:MAG: protein kinase [Candidatus Aminicenantes bacterium]|nr:protein kinase [Candidatus Aminicenantes bacterium]